MAGLRTRKNYYHLTREERAELLDAILALKASGEYDSIVKMHQDSMDHATPWDKDLRPNRRNAAHRGPAFLPWHRQYLQVYEQALQEISGNSELSLPYWDWISDSQLPDPATSALWMSEGIGGDGELATGWVVPNGPFARWPLAHNGGNPPDMLQRHLGVIVPGLPGPTARDQMMAQTVYDVEPWDENRDRESLRSVLEGWFVTNDGSRLHNQVHVWVGGSMLPGTSPNDPVFFFHHCMVDKLWADWQLAQLANGRSLEESYAPHRDGPQGHNLNDPMFPWQGDEQITPKSMLDHRKLGFQYDSELSTESANADATVESPTTNSVAVNQYKQ